MYYNYYVYIDTDCEDKIMRLKHDKKLKNNLKLLRTCSKIEEIHLKAMENEIEKYKRYLETTSRGISFRTHLENLYYTDFERSGLAAPEILSTDDLLRYLPDKSQTIPKIFERDYKRHKDVFEHQPDIDLLEDQLQEHRTLQELTKASEYSTQDLVDFMESPERTPNFASFCQDAQKHSGLFLNLKYKHKAAYIARKNQLYTKAFREDLAKTLPRQKIALCRDLIGRTYKGAILSASAIALSATLALGIISINTPTIDTTQGTESEISSSETYTPTTNPYDDILATPDTTPSLPISETGNLHSYEDACDDFYKKTAEVYKYNTGETINLSGYGQQNMAYSETTIYVVEHNGNTYRFSAQSPHRSNSRYLEQALEATGATVTKQPNSTISYIHDDDKSIAIVDGSGNPVKSGNILVDASSGAEMYNQSYVNSGRRILEAQGIDTSGMSEAELVGTFILSDNYNIQNEELSRALGETQGLLYYIKNHFYIKDDKEDSFAIDTYESKSKKFAENFNSAVQEKTTEDDLYLVESEGFEPGD